MGKYVVAMVLAGFCLLGMPAMAGDVPGVGVADFGSPEANAIWTILAGQGVWGAILFGVLGVLWKIGKPFIDAWVQKHKLATLFTAIEAGVASTQATYVDAIKEASKDGKVTEEEAEIARGLARTAAIDFLRAQGIDVVKEYGHAALDMLIEYSLSKLKLSNALKAVALPLPDLGPSAPSV